MTTHNIYVIELDNEVLRKKKFKDANPDYIEGSPCVYVGMTSKSPRERYEQHRTGYRNKKGHKLSANIVEKYGTCLRGSLFNHIKPVKSRAEALELEEKLALDLRRKVC